MTIYLAIATKLDLSLKRIGGALDFRIQCGAAIFSSRTNDVPQEMRPWDRPHSASIEKRVPVVPPHSWGNTKLLGGRND